MKIDEFITTAGFLSRALRKNLMALLENISEISFDAESTFPSELSVPDASGTIRDILMRADVVVDYAETAAALKHEDLVLQATTPLTDLQTHLTKLQEALSGAVETTSEFTDKSITVATVEEGVALVSSEGRRLELGPLFAPIDATLDATFLALNRIPILNDRKVGLASNLASELASARDRYNAVYEELRNTRSVVKRFATEASTALGEIDSAYHQTRDLTEEIESILATARSHGEYITELDQIREEYMSLKSDLEAFSPDFETFRRSVSDSEERFQTYIREIQETQKRVADFLSENDELIQKSKEALHWSTAAGLSSSFAASQASLDNPIRLATLQFYAAILFFGLSVLVATNSIPFISDFINLPTFPTDLDANNWAYIGRILSVATLKFLIVAPALVFLSFSLKNLNTLNRLRHEYGFKRTLSIAVPGFKEEAPNNEEMIVAAAFGELMSNPTDAAHKSGRGQNTQPSNSWRTRILNQALDLAEKASTQKSNN